MKLPGASMRIHVAVVAIVFCSFAVCRLDAGEGFGALNRKIIKELSMPTGPVVQLSATRLELKVQQPGGSFSSSSVAERARALFKGQLMKGDRRFVFTDRDPQLVVEIVITELNADVKYAECEEKSPLLGYSTGRMVSCDRVIGNASMTFDVRKQPEDFSLDSDNFEFHMDEKYRKGEAHADEKTLQSQMLEAGISKFVRRLVPGTQSVWILLPKGSLETLSTQYAAQNLWSDYWEKLEAIPAKQKLEDEAYRQFALGVACEGLAYSTQDLTRARELLKKAAEHYNTAKEYKPEEKYFVQPWPYGGFSTDSPVNRIADAISNNQRLIDYYLFLKSEASAGAKDIESDLPEEKVEIADNGTIIEMKKSGVPERSVVQYLEDVKQVCFDVSASGLSALSKARVGERLILLMQKLAKSEKQKCRGVSGHASASKSLPLAVDPGEASPARSNTSPTPLAATSPSNGTLSSAENQQKVKKCPKCGTVYRDLRVERCTRCNARLVVVSAP